jgi:hypothetical protein
MVEDGDLAVENAAGARVPRSTSNRRIRFPRFEIIGLSNGATALTGLRGGLRAGVAIRSNDKRG